MNKTKLPISNKESIRAEVKKRISRLSVDKKERAAQEMCEKLWMLPRVQKSINLIIYEALPDEVNLQYFFQQAQKNSKNIIMITPSGDYPDLPTGGTILVPGRAFTLSGKRIGRGSGWYDTFLQEHPNYYTIGVGFACQLFDDIPQDPWDISMNEVIVG